MATDLWLVDLVNGPSFRWDSTGSDNRFSLKEAGRGPQPGDAVVEGAGTGGFGTGGSGTVRILSTSAGGALNASNFIAASSAGPTAGRTVGPAEGSPLMWFTTPLAADVTISGTISFLITSSEVLMTDNITIVAVVYRVTSEGQLVQILRSPLGTECGTGGLTAPPDSWSGTPTSTLVRKGERIALMWLFDDATAVTMAAGAQFNMGWGGTVGGQQEAKISFTETLTFNGNAPTGTVLYLRDTAASITPGAALAKRLITTQGSGTATSVRTTTNGPMAFPGSQWTSTAGGSTIEWYSNPLNAVTLDDQIQVDLGSDGTALESVSSPFDALTVEIAVVDTDGSNPQIWGRSYTSTIGVHSGGVISHCVLGGSLSLTQGQRIRLRVYSNDMRPQGNQVAGTNRTFRYDGTGSYAAAMYLTQTVTDAPVTVRTTVSAVLRQAAFVALDRVRETTTSTGTGALTLAGAVSGFQSFTAIMDGDYFAYAVVGSTEWEAGIGYCAGRTLVRQQVLASSNAGALVSFSAGTKDVFNQLPAAHGTLPIISRLQAANMFVPRDTTTYSPDDYEILAGFALELGLTAGLEIG